MPFGARSVPTSLIPTRVQSGKISKVSYILGRIYSIRQMATPAPECLLLTRKRSFLPGFVFGRQGVKYIV